jgi:hypothetical protein
VPRPHPVLLTEPSGIRVRQMTAFARLVVLAMIAPVRSASIRQAPLRFAFVRFAPRRLALRRLAREILQPVQLRSGEAVYPIRLQRLAFAPFLRTHAPDRQQLVARAFAFLLFLP